jgi:hypothetical protein
VALLALRIVIHQFPPRERVLVAVNKTSESY